MPTWASPRYSFSCDAPDRRRGYPAQPALGIVQPEPASLIKVKKVDPREAIAQARAKYAPKLTVTTGPERNKYAGNPVRGETFVAMGHGVM